MRCPFVPPDDVLIEVLEDFKYVPKIFKDDCYTVIYRNYGSDDKKKKHKSDTPILENSSKVAGNVKIVVEELESINYSEDSYDSQCDSILETNKDDSELGSLYFVKSASENKLVTGEMIPRDDRLYRLSNESTIKKSVIPEKSIPIKMPIKIKREKFMQANALANKISINFNKYLDLAKLEWKRCLLKHRKELIITYLKHYYEVYYDFDYNFNYDLKFKYTFDSESQKVTYDMKDFTTWKYSDHEAYEDLKYLNRTFPFDEKAYNSSIESISDNVVT
ncbi:unnamed protein product [Gordionus sp. m RMFG-2023]